MIELGTGAQEAARPYPCNLKDYGNGLMSEDISRLRHPLSLRIILAPYEGDGNCNTEVLAGTMYAVHP